MPPQWIRKMTCRCRACCSGLMGQGPGPCNGDFTTACASLNIAMQMKLSLATHSSKLAALVKLYFPCSPTDIPLTWYTRLFIKSRPATPFFTCQSCRTCIRQRLRPPRSAGHSGSPALTWGVPLVCREILSRPVLLLDHCFFGEFFLTRNRCAADTRDDDTSTVW